MMRAVQPVLRFLRTLLVVITVGAMGVGVLFALGEWPPRDAAGERRSAAQADARRREAETARAEAARRATLAVTVDAGTVAVPTRVPRFLACDGTGESGIDAARLGASGRDVIVLGCDGVLRAIAFVHSLPLEILRFRPAGDQGDARVRSFTVASDDVTGDGAVDWLIGTLRATDSTSPATGSLHLLPGDGRGGFGQPTLLAPLAVTRISTGLVDVDPVTDFAVMHRPDPMGSRAPEAWLFRGGPLPVRGAKLTLARDAVDVTLFDVDVDGRLDLVSVGGGDSQTSFAGDGDFGFSGTLATALGARTGITRVRGPALGTGLLLGGNSPAWLVGSAPAGTVRTLALASAATAYDAEAEGTSVVIAWVADGALTMHRYTDGELVRVGQSVLPLQDGRIIDVALGDFVGDDSLDVVALVERSGTLRERDLVVLEVGSPESLALAAERGPIEVSPLHLESTLR